VDVFVVFSHGDFSFYGDIRPEFAHMVPKFDMLLGRYTGYRSTKPQGPFPVPLPERALTPQGIEAFYRQEGARHVNVTLLWVGQVDRAATDMWTAATSGMVSAKERHTFARVHGLIRDGKRLNENTKMMYLRHRALRSALDEEERSSVAYAAFIYIREDNVFVPPGPEFGGWIRPLMKAQAAGSGVIHVNQHCAYKGDLSDKVYFGNRAAMRALMGTTMEDLAGHIRVWMLRSKFAADALNGSVETTFPPTENLFTRLLRDAHVAVHSSEFSRTQACRVWSRDDGLRLCVMSFYRGCTISPDALPVCFRRSRPRTRRPLPAQRL
jgi:hypothetical protein